MAFVADTYLDLTLAGIRTAGTRLDLCSQEPVTYAGATTTYTLGRKTSYSIGAPENGTSNGRMITCPAVTDGSNAANGTASHWALTNGSDTLVATGSLSASKTMVSGDPWTCDAFTIVLPDFVSQ